jgi:glycerol-3-phosphate cytidylyltransferase
LLLLKVAGELRRPWHLRNRLATGSNSDSYFHIESYFRIEVQANSTISNWKAKTGAQRTASSPISQRQGNALEIAAMIRIGYAPGAYDLFHMGHLNLLRRAKERCDFLIAGVVADEILIQHKQVTPVIPLAERLEIVRNIRFVDMAHAAMTNNKTEIWKELRFNVLFKGDDWRETERGQALERDFAALGVEVVYFPYTEATSSSVLRKTLQNIDAMAQRAGANSPHSAWPHAA